MEMKMKIFKFFVQKKIFQHTFLICVWKLFLRDTFFKINSIFFLNPFQFFWVKKTNLNEINNPISIQINFFSVDLTINNISIVRIEYFRF